MALKKKDFLLRKREDGTRVRGPHMIIDLKTCEFLVLFSPVFMVPPSSLWPFQRESHPLPSYYFLKIVSDIFTLNKKRAGELQKPFPTRSRIASEAPLSFSTSSHPALNRFLWKLYSAFQPAFLLTFA